MPRAFQIRSLLFCCKHFCFHGSSLSGFSGEVITALLENSKLSHLTSHVGSKFQGHSNHPPRIPTRCPFTLAVLFAHSMWQSPGTSRLYLHLKQFGLFMNFTLADFSEKLHRIATVISPNFRLPHYGLSNQSKQVPLHKESLRKLPNVLTKIGESSRLNYLGWIENDFAIIIFEIFNLNPTCIINPGWETPPIKFALCN